MLPGTLLLSGPDRRRKTGGAENPGGSHHHGGKSQGEAPQEVARKTPSHPLQAPRFLLPRMKGQEKEEKQEYSARLSVKQRVNEIRKKFEQNREGNILVKDKILDKNKKESSKKRKEIDRGEVRPEESPARRKKLEKDKNPPRVLAARTNQENLSIEALSPLPKNNHAVHAVPGGGRTSSPCRACYQTGSAWGGTADRI